MDYEREIQEFLLRLLKDDLLVPEKKLKPEARIYHDLGITGDDAVEFLLAVRNRYPFDARDFDFQNYFDGEGLPLPGSKILGIPSNGPKVKTPLTIIHLAKVCAAQKWFDPE